MRIMRNPEVEHMASTAIGTQCIPNVWELFWHHPCPDVQGSLKQLSKDGLYHPFKDWVQRCYK